MNAAGSLHPAAQSAASVQSTCSAWAEHNPSLALPQKKTAGEVRCCSLDRLGNMPFFLFVVLVAFSPDAAGVVRRRRHGGFPSLHHTASPAHLPAKARIHARADHPRDSLVYLLSHGLVSAGARGGSSLALASGGAPARARSSGRSASPVFPVC